MRIDDTLTQGPTESSTLTGISQALRSIGAI